MHRWSSAPPSRRAADLADGARRRSARLHRPGPHGRRRRRAWPTSWRTASPASTRRRSATASRPTSTSSSALDAEVEQILLGRSPPSAGVLVTNHEVFGYFADRYGFEVLGAVIPAARHAGRAERRASWPTSPRLIGERRRAGDLRRDVVARRGWPTPGGRGRPTSRSSSSSASRSGGAGSGADTYVDMVRTDAAAHRGRAGADRGTIVPMSWLLDPFEPEFMQRALLAGMLAVLASLGRRARGSCCAASASSGDALAHGVIPGMALAVLWGFNLTVGALADRRGHGRAASRWSTGGPGCGEDTGIGLLFVGMLALGVIIISKSRLVHDRRAEPPVRRRPRRDLGATCGSRPAPRPSWCWS